MRWYPPAYYQRQLSGLKITSDRPFAWYYPGRRLLERGNIYKLDSCALVDRLVQSSRLKDCSDKWEFYWSIWFSLAV